jgi:hypothetical protein
MAALPSAGGTTLPSLAGLTRPPGEDQHSIFVGDLAPEVNDFVLQETFRQFFPTVRSAKVITDPVTTRSKGYGFVRFSDEAERDRALTDMNGFMLASRPIRVSLATARRAPTSTATGLLPPTITGGYTPSASLSGVHPSELDPTNTTLFIGGLSGGVTEEQLRSIFGRYGDIVYAKIPQGKGCGFVQFVDRAAAEVAMAELNGQVVGSSAIRISWGRSTSRAPAAREAAHLPAALGVYGAGAGAFGAGALGGLGGGYGAFDPVVGAGLGGAYPNGAVAGGFPGAYPGDPYAAFGAYAVDPAAYAAFAQPSAFGALGGNGMANGAGNPLQAGAAQAGLAGQQGNGNGMYEAMGPADVQKMNAAYILRNQPALIGAHLRQQGAS